MKALIFGTTGQVALELARTRPDAFEAVHLSRAEADLANPAACHAAVLAHRPDVVINAAAYTAVDRAETDEALATVINADSPAEIARACSTLTIPLLHISTDYVFDGSGVTPWQIRDPVGPLGAYGRSKLLGEQAIGATGCAHAILRTSWVFSAHGTNFVKTMLRLSETRDTLAVVADQVGGPTPARNIAQTLWQMATAFGAGRGVDGTYHFAGAPDVSWADFARAIFAAAGRNVAVTDIPGSAYPTPARRPGNSRLDCGALFTVFGIARPDWRVGLDTVLRDLGAKP